MNIIGITGSSGSGKTYFSKKLGENFSGDRDKTVPVFGIPLLPQWRAGRWLAKEIQNIQPNKKSHHISAKHIGQCNQPQKLTPMILLW